MTNIIVAIVFTLLLLAFGAGYMFGNKDTEFEYHQAEREARQRRIDNARRFYDIERQARTLETDTHY